MAATRTGGAPTGQLGALFSLGAAGGLTDGQLLDRFLAREDPAASEAAFAELVDRHGALVLSVCRRELRDPHDASDAFQATFLVLVSNAGALRHWQTVGGWLVGVARRVSARMRFETARRRRHLARVGADRGACEPDSLVAPSIGDEPDYAPLIAEVDRLPERFRAPVVLHYLEGLSTEATALRLGCARGTVLSRLSRARDRLRRRLEARGYDPIVVLPARWLPPELVPTALVHDTLRATGSLGLAGAAIDGVVPATVAHLSRRVARAMAVSRIGVAASIIVLAAAGMSIALAATLNRDDGIQQGQAMERPRPATENRRETRPADPIAASETVVLRGRVLDTGGQPATGAEILLDVREVRASLPSGPRRVGTAGPDGRFTLTIPRSSIEPMYGTPNDPLPKAIVGAVMPGSGLDWAPIDPRKVSDPIALQLRRDDVPIEGRIISLEGQPVAGASVKVVYVMATPPSWLEEQRAGGGMSTSGRDSRAISYFLPGNDGPFAPGKTGPDGGFRMTGFGRDRVALLSIEGDSIERTQVMVVTASDPAFRPVPLPAVSTGQSRIEGPRFELAVGPGRIVEGRVRDRDSGRPIAGARVRAFFGEAVTTDHEGRFRFTGQPAAGDRSATVSVEGEPYVAVSRSEHDVGGMAPIHFELALRRGRWVEGKVVDSATRKPIRAMVEYHPFRDNPHLEDYPDATFLNNNISDDAVASTDEDGRFRAVALPGGGALIIRAVDRGYQRDATPLDPNLRDRIFAVIMPGAVYQGEALVPIDVPEGKTLVIPDIALTPGRTQHLRVVGPDGKPVSGARVSCLSDVSLGRTRTGDEVTVVHTNPGSAESVVVVDESRSLAASVALRGDEPDPVTVVLQPMAAVSGRVVDEDGRPRPGVQLSIEQKVVFRGQMQRIGRSQPRTIGPDGRFRITDVVPGMAHSILVIRPNERNFLLRTEGYLHEMEWTLAPGETRDWGDVQVHAVRP